MALAFLVMMIEGSTLGFLSYMLEPLFDRVFAPGGSGALIWVGGAILALFLVRAITSILGRWLLARVNQHSAGTMQVDLIRHLLTLDASFFQTHSPGTLIERVQGDTLAAQGASVLVIGGIGRDLISLVGLFVVAIMIDPLWTAAALVGAPLLLLPAVVLRRYLRRKAVLTRNQAGLRATRLDEIFHGIQAVKLNRMEGYQAGRFQRIIDTIVRAEVKTALARATMPALVDVITGIGFFAVLMLGGSEVAAGTRTTGEFMSFFTAMALTFQPIRRLSDLAGQWQVAEASLERIFTLLDTRPQGSRPAVSRTLPAPGAPAIRFEAVTFDYPDRPVLNGLSFTAEAGKVTALVGSSGAGKSTVFQLIAALIEPQAGRILIGGVDVQDLSLADQRALLASVSQDAALFDETLRENLLLGRTDRDPARLAQVLADAEVAAFTDALPLGLDTPAGPRGSALSGGQRQRVAIARALLADAPVLLLDEATSALDTRTEAAVSAALSRAQSGRTTLVIAHRLSTVKAADKIIVLDHGRLIEEGTHDSLMARGGLYAQLQEAQLRD
ncbi:ATP-binding cassette domain-containing protein [Tabrizicola sp.]|uniref:ABC transporter ATP-binding protein n=1 Tax=Tabrizicola sp. TaxID=2005166 RepID=UPI001A53E98B|nr:ATP-binding cassette domain-containing protein [Tabrizicola sp.]MBL9061690.1 ATP-binding cassette domain-containing protein [Tabrizicola sp.]